MHGLSADVCVMIKYSQLGTNFIAVSYSPCVLDDDCDQRYHTQASRYLELDHVLILAAEQLLDLRDAMSLASLVDGVSGTGNRAEVK